MQHQHNLPNASKASR